MLLVAFRDWTLTVDREVTKATYASVVNGSAEDCKCPECLNYIQGRDKAFPDEIKSLFDMLGVDYRKESEVWRMYKHKDGLHIYSGFFHFKGSFEGRDCFVTADGRNGTFSMTDINESFSIGFRIVSDLAYFKDYENLVQVEFEVKIPWTIDEKLECDW
ncbi:hypothetical protein HQN83_20075 [Pedobacter sp. LMG 31643]|nr:hypothetical protein [Pedobacter foliorum]